MGSRQILVSVLAHLVSCIIEELFFYLSVNSAGGTEKRLRKILRGWKKSFVNCTTLLRLKKIDIDTNVHCLLHVKTWEMFPPKETKVELKPL